eukprot:jgi/Mesen1/9997/ME000072S09414
MFDRIEDVVTDGHFAREASGEEGSIAAVAVAQQGPCGGSTEWHANGGQWKAKAVALRDLGGKRGRETSRVV